MYERFFGLEDEPFRLTPDPRYLFLSPKHAEALAHLRLGLTESSGFVCITGDVGTGKTTLLRAFLSELGPNVDAVYTYVPPLSAHELVRRICREFGLPAAHESQSDLVEELHAHLVAQRRAGRLCVVVLDEAQALSIELLEQVRLLLNLETPTEKLLRIVLVGQPQLGKLLLDPGLAQLNQRITLRWHLGPLSYREMIAYVSHRLAVASGGRAPRLFTRPALRLLYSVSGGVPRLVNMIGHRALLAAFVAREARVGRRFVGRAYREIQAVPLPGSLSPRRKAAFAALGLAVGIGIVAFGAPPVDRLLALRLRNHAETAIPAPDPGGGHAEIAQPAAAPDIEPKQAAAAPPESAFDSDPASPPTVQAVEAADSEPLQSPATPAVVAAVPTAPPAPSKPPHVSSAADLARRLGSVADPVSARAATETLLTSWGEQPLAADEVGLLEHLDSIAWRRGLQDLTLTGNHSMLRLLDLPAMIPLRIPGEKASRYVALTGMDGSRVVLSIGKMPVTVDAELFDSLWSGEAHVLWRDFEGLGPALHRGTRGIGVLHLQQLLTRAGALSGQPTGVFDTGTEMAVLNFQREHQLDADGIVGPLTRIVLYATSGSYAHPTLAVPEQEAS
jgi:general secretion pathway protein A